MSVLALQVDTVRRHPNADSLWIYEMKGRAGQTAEARPTVDIEAESSPAPALSIVQVVANSDTLYERGDVVAVALVGAVLKDGTEIRKTRLRGVDSYGMALGRVSDPVGTDVSQRYCAPAAPAPAPAAESAAPAPAAAHIKWTSIELLHHVVRHMDELRAAGEPVPSEVVYRAKVKLDGTNGGVQVLPSGEVFAQSRTRMVTLGDDNIGFAAWVDANRSYFAALARADGPITIFGEWCGHGIQKRTAISKVPRRLFVVFAVQYGDHQHGPALLDIEPSRIRVLLPEHPEVFVLPWYGEEIRVCFGDRDALGRSAEAINAMVAAVETCDPWVHEVFGVDGLGEGLVLYPILTTAAGQESQQPIGREPFSWLMFKAKGEKHQVVRQKQPAQVDPEKARGVEGFVELFVTRARLEQAVAEGCQGQLDMRRMGDFLKWIGQDIKKESEVELADSGLAWSDVGKAVTRAAQRWYSEQCQKG